MIAEVDKFCTSIRAVPGAEGHPEIKKKLEFIASSKDKLKLAVAEALLQRKAHREHRPRCWTRRSKTRMPAPREWRNSSGRRPLWMETP